MLELFQPLISGPVLPATILLGLVLVWSLFTIVVGYGLEMHGHLPFHLDVSLAHHPVFHALGDALGSVVLTPTKWLNLRSVPLILWLSVFALTWWATSVTWWFTVDPWIVAKLGPFANIVLIARNIAFGLLLTKILTAPMQGLFRNTPQLNAKSLVGEEAEICSYDATPQHGQAKFKTDGAPLLLNVRTDGPHLPKGTRVWITYYDSEHRVYLVSPTTTDSFPSPLNGNAS
ncbi:MAG: hypothetical protein ACK5OB_14370 [Pirellula sp.]